MVPFGIRVRISLPVPGALRKLTSAETLAGLADAVIVKSTVNIAAAAARHAKIMASQLISWHRLRIEYPQET
jgi:hypothetical protein